jgi:hypothetical protein
LRRKSRGSKVVWKLISRIGKIVLRIARGKKKEKEFLILLTSRAEQGFDLSPQPRT